MAEVVAHQPLDALTGRVTRIREALGDAFLELVAEQILMPLGLEVQDRAHAEQELLRIVERARAGAALLEEARVGQLGNGLRAEEVAQPAGRFLHVGLELVERVVELGVPLGDERLQGVERARRGPREVGCLEKPIEQRRVADDRARVGQREQEFRVVGGQAGALPRLAHVVPDGQAQIPERVQERVQKALVGIAQRTGKENQEVDIRVQAELPPAVAAQREDPDQLRRGARVGEQLLDERVHAERILPQRLAPALAALGRGDELAARRLQPLGARRPSELH